MLVAKLCAFGVDRNEIYGEAGILASNFFAQRREASRFYICLRTFSAEIDFHSTIIAIGGSPVAKAEIYAMRGLILEEWRILGDSNT